MQDLPQDILRLIGQRLDVVDLRSMRETCKTFASEICQACGDCVSFVCSNERQVAIQKLKTKVALKPFLQGLVTVLNERSDNEAIDAHFSALAMHPVTRHRLKHLVVQSLSRAPVVYINRISELVGLRQLSLVGYSGSFDDTRLNLLSRLTCLSIKWDDADAFPQRYPRLMASVGEMTDLEMLLLPTHLTLHSVDHLSRLTRLTHLEFRGAWPESLDSSVVIPSLLRLTGLKSLDLHLPPLISSIEPLTRLHMLSRDNCKGDDECGLGVRLDNPPCLGEYLHFVTRNMQSFFTGLSVGNNRSVDARGELQLVGKLTCLRHLQISSIDSSEGDDLSPLSDLTRLQSFSYTFSSDVPRVREKERTASMVVMFERRWTDTLVNLTLDNVAASDPLPSLRALKRLENLVLRANTKDRESPELQMSWLPLNIHSLSLAHFEVAVVDPVLDLDRCETLLLHSCTTRDAYNFRKTLRALPHLNNLHIADVSDLEERHVMEVGSMRHLTFLGVKAIGNAAVTNAMLCHLTSLSKLRLLLWHAGDALDVGIDPMYLERFRDLIILSVPSTEYQRMLRWGSIEILNDLARCQLVVSL